MVTIVTISSLLVLGGFTRPGLGASPLSLEGIFTILWGDGPRSGKSVTEYFLTIGPSDAIQLEISDEAMAELGGVLDLNQKRVVVQGTWLGGETAMQVHAISLAKGVNRGNAGVYGSQPWVSILCKFSDYTDEPRAKPYFEGMYSSVYPGLDNFWRQNSYNLVNLAGSSVAGWYVLPHERAYYVDYYNGLDSNRAAADCTGVANPYVNFSLYVGLNLMFNADLDGYAWGGTWPGCLDGVCKYWRTTWEPPWGYESIGVIAHETGHGFGLPHSEGPCRQVYDNRWDVMSDVWSNGTDPVYGTLGQHTISYHKELLGWLTSGQVYTGELETLKTITLEKLALPQTNNYLGAVIPIDGQSNHFYTLEVRQPSGNPLDYDKWLPGFAVIIHEVTLGQLEPAIVIDDQEGDCNTADAGAMFTSGEVFTDAAHGILVTIDYSTSTGYVVTINNHFEPLLSLAISGPEMGSIGESLAFTATIMPVNAATPITYKWEASDLAPVEHSSGVTDTIDLTWDEVGTKSITVTATNADGTLMDIYHSTIKNGTPPAGVTLNGPEVSYIGSSSIFIAQVNPITVTLPITYVWTIDGSQVITHSGDVDDSLELAWTSLGLHQVNVSAANKNGSASDDFTIMIYRGFYLPWCSRE